MDAIRIRAKFLIVTPNRLLHPGTLTVRQGRVVEVTDDKQAEFDIDLGERILLPGLINAHTHLEFSGLQTPLPPGDSFPDWISSVVAYRNSELSGDAIVAQQRRAASVARGLAEAYSSGTALLADIVTPPWALNRVRPDFLSALKGCLIGRTTGDSIESHVDREDWLEHFAPLGFPQVLACAEILGLTADRLESSCKWALELVSRSPDDMVHDMVRGFAISPHAPYSVDLRIVEKSLACRSTARPLVVMHLAESPAELQWLEHGGGPFFELFERLGLRPERAPASIEECLRFLEQQKRALLIHGNYLTQKQIGRIARHRRLSVVYCPRTHAHFSHAPYPLAALHAAGATVVLATDSRASNPDLRLWDEVVEARRQHPWFAPEEALSAVTTIAAKALSADDDFGSLEVGKLAHGCVVDCHLSWNVTTLLERLTTSRTDLLHCQPLAALFR